DVLERLGHPRLYVADYSIGTRRQQQTGPGWMKGYPLARVPVGWTNAQALVLGVHMYLNPPTAAQWGLYGSYDLDILGFYPRPLRDLTERLRDVEDSPLHLRLLQMGAVANALALHPAAWWRNLAPVAEVPSLFAMPIHVFRVPDALPRSWVVGRTIAAGGASALQAL